MSAKGYITGNLSMLVRSYVSLTAEEQALQDTAARLAEIAAEKADLLASATEAVNRYNLLFGTEYTLQDAVNRWGAPAAPPQP